MEPRSSGGARGGRGWRSGRLCAPRFGFALPGGGCGCALPASPAAPGRRTGTLPALSRPRRRPSQQVTIPVPPGSQFQVVVGLAPRSFRSWDLTTPSPLLMFKKAVLAIVQESTPVWIIKNKNRGVGVKMDPFRLMSLEEHFSLIVKNQFLHRWRKQSKVQVESGDRRTAGTLPSVCSGQRVLRLAAIQ